ncbi:hypothetical protein POM88_031538 [Heracleum sosnowskyi]|uniref:Uncharacterized protein n=1 Tax=Heracleum sosnowskyi TaxID=360622 RepID=A0AAD8MGQ6_9APIA|nr:hypothetical protein POM88_031538 [Heracleum sosnowskyi]
MLLKYRGDESVQKLAEENTEHRKALVETHTLGRKPVSLVIEKMTKIQQLIEDGNEAEANAVASNGKTHAPNWLVGRQGKKTISTSTPVAHTEQYVHELTAKIRHDLEGELEAKVNRKVQENMTQMLKKLGEANPSLKLDFGEFCATVSSDQDNNSTPMTQGGTTS